MYVRMYAHANNFFSFIVILFHFSSFLFVCMHCVLMITSSSTSTPTRIVSQSVSPQSSTGSSDNIPCQKPHTKDFISFLCLRGWCFYLLKPDVRTYVYICRYALRYVAHTPHSRYCFGLHAALCGLTWFLF